MAREREPAGKIIFARHGHATHTFTLKLNNEREMHESHGAYHPSGISYQRAVQFALKPNLHICNGMHDNLSRPDIASQDLRFELASIDFKCPIIPRKILIRSEATFWREKGAIHTDF